MKDLIDEDSSKTILIFYEIIQKEKFLHCILVYNSKAISIKNQNNLSFKLREYIKVLLLHDTKIMQVKKHGNK